METKFEAENNEVDLEGVYDVTTGDLKVYADREYIGTFFNLVDEQQAKAKFDEWALGDDGGAYPDSWGV